MPCLWWSNPCFCSLGGAFLVFPVCVPVGWGCPGFETIRSFFMCPLSWVRMSAAVLFLSVFLLSYVCRFFPNPTLPWPCRQVLNLSCRVDPAIGPPPDFLFGEFCFTSFSIDPMWDLFSLFSFTGFVSMKSSGRLAGTYLRAHNCTIFLPVLQIRPNNLVYLRS